MPRPDQPSPYVWRKEVGEDGTRLAPPRVPHGSRAMPCFRARHADNTQVEICEPNVTRWYSPRVSRGHTRSRLCGMCLQKVGSVHVYIEHSQLEPLALPLCIEDIEHVIVPTGWTDELELSLPFPSHKCYVFN